jgi:hypothetical protein
MHSPVNFIVVNEITAGRIAKADAHRLSRQNRKPSENAKRASRFQGVKLLRRARIA